MRCSMTARRLCRLPWPLIEQRLEQQLAATVREGDRDAGGLSVNGPLSGPEALHPPYSVSAAGCSSNNRLASQSGPQACNDLSSVLRRRQSERPSIFATELGGTLVADFMRRCSDTVAGGDEACARLKQANLFLILQWAERGHSFEMTVKRRHAHRRLFGEFVHPQGERVIPADTLDDSIDSRQCGIRRGNVMQHPAIGPCSTR